MKIIQASLSLVSLLVGHSHSAWELFGEIEFRPLIGKAWTPTLWTVCFRGPKFCFWKSIYSDPFYLGQIFTLHDNRHHLWAPGFPRTCPVVAVCDSFCRWLLSSQLWCVESCFFTVSISCAMVLFGLCFVDVNDEDCEIRKCARSLSQATSEVKQFDPKVLGSYGDFDV